MGERVGGRAEGREMGEEGRVGRALRMRRLEGRAVRRAAVGLVARGAKVARGEGGAEKEVRGGG